MKVKYQSSQNLTRILFDKLGAIQHNDPNKNRYQSSNKGLITYQ